MSHETPVVFVVDDDVSVRESLELLIHSAGWQPETFDSAQKFLLARDRVPNCLILDVNLPDLSGLDLQSSCPSSAPTCRSSSSPAMATCR